MTPGPLSLRTIEECQSTIRDKFIHDCLTGSRAGVLPPHMNAVGQYFNLPDRTQRGLHGTAAALRVTAAEGARDDAARRIARGIVTYLQNRKETELRLAAPAVRDRALLLDKLRHDRVNTVKQAEVLRALSFVSHGLATSDEIKTQVSERLLAGQARDGNGWAFILGSDQTSHILPTTHAIRALAANGYDVDRWSAILVRGLISRSQEPQTDFLTACVDCFALQILIELNAIARGDARDALDRLWRALRRHMVTPREVNLDFFDGDRQNFVRVPWQLHLVTCSALVRPYRRYLSGDAQRALRTVVFGVLDEAGFRYPESGEHLSTRTYAYIYDSLASLLGRRGGRHRPEIILAHGVTSAGWPVRVFSHIGRWMLAGGAAAILVVGVAGWLRDDGTRLSELAPNFLSAAVLLVLSWFLRPRQRS